MNISRIIGCAIICLTTAQPLTAGELEPGPNPNAPLNLTCRGGGSATRENSASLYGSNGASAYGTLGQRDVAFGDQVDLWIDGEIGSLRMPRSMLPRIRGGKDGWFGLRNIQMNQHEITGTITVSILNKPKLRIDRYTGAISISGKSGDFTGTCQKFDPKEQKQAF